jgi:DNA polymerase-3 subunit beta
VAFAGNKICLPETRFTFYSGKTVSFGHETNVISSGRLALLEWFPKGNPLIGKSQMSPSPIFDQSNQSQVRTNQKPVQSSSKTNSGLKISCERIALLTPCQHANLIVPSGHNQPILRNFKIIAGDNRCTMQATDQEVGVRFDLKEVNIASSGELLVPADRLTAILKETSDETITIESTDTTSLLRIGKSEFELNAEDPTTFPDIPITRPKQYNTVSAELLSDGIHRTIFAAAKEHSNHALTGTLWEMDNTELRLVSTDGKRLALAQCEAKAHGGNVPPGHNHVLPTKAMEILGRLVGESEQEIKMTLRENHALFRVGRAVIYTRLLEGRFPPYREILPKSKKIEIQLNVGSFHAVIRQAAILVGREAQGVEFTFKDNTLTLNTRSSDAGRSTVQLAIEYSSEPLTIVLAPGLVMDALRTLPDDQSVTLELIDRMKAAVFRMGTEYSYLVMPLH